MSNFLTSHVPIWTLFQSRTLNYLKPLLGCSLGNHSVFLQVLKVFLIGRTLIFEVQRKLHLKATATQAPTGILTGNSDL